MNWGVDATGWAQAVTNGMLQKAGGTFPLTADVDFGALFGLKAAYFESRLANPATSGTVRLTSVDPGIVFRNNANSGNLILTTDSSDNLRYNGNVIASPLGSPLIVAQGGTGVSSLTPFAVLAGGTTSTNPVQSIASVGTTGQVLTSNGAGALPTFQNTSVNNSGLINQLAYYAATGTTLSGLASITSNRALASNSSGLPVASATTDIELGFVNGVTSSIQTQINATVTVANAALPRAGGTMSGVIAMGANKITGLANGTVSTDAANVGEVNVQTATSSINTTFIGVGRNRIHNAEMLFDQRNEGTAVSIQNNGGSGQYTLDWHRAFSGPANAGIFTVQQKTDTPPPGFSAYLRVQTTTAAVSFPANSFYALEWQLEGIDYRDFLFGTGSAKTITFSFYTRSSSAGNYGASIEAQSGNRSYTFTYNIPVANTWTYITQTIPGDTVGTWVTAANVLGLIIGIDIGSGSNFETTPNSWQNGDLFRTASSNRIISALNATLDFTGLQLELGSQATSFEYKPYNQQLAECQRIFEKSYQLGDKPGTLTSVGLWSATAQLVGATTAETGLVPYKVPKAFRINGSPNTAVILYNANNGTQASWTWISSAGATNQRATSVNNSGPNGFDVFQIVSTDVWTDGHWTSEVFLAS